MKPKLRIKCQFVLLKKALDKDFNTFLRGNVIL